MTLLWCHKWKVFGQTLWDFFCRWNDMGNITHNKSTILVELVSKEGDRPLSHGKQNRQ